MAKKRIYELDTAAATTGLYFPVDANGETAAKKFPMNGLIYTGSTGLTVEYKEIGNWDMATYPKRVVSAITSPSDILCIEPGIIYDDNGYQHGFTLWDPWFMQGTPNQKATGTVNISASESGLPTIIGGVAGAVTGNPISISETGSASGASYNMVFAGDTNANGDSKSTRYNPLGITMSYNDGSYRFNWLGCTSSHTPKVMLKNEFTPLTEGIAWTWSVVPGSYIEIQMLSQSGSKARQGLYIEIYDTASFATHAHAQSNHAHDLTNSHVHPTPSLTSQTATFTGGVWGMGVRVFIKYKPGESTLMLAHNGIDKVDLMYSDFGVPSPSIVNTSALADFNDPNINRGFLKITRRMATLS